MAKPQPTDSHLRMAHQIGEQLMVSHFTEQQRRILDLILRLSWGCGKKDAYIPHQNDFEIVGVGQGHIKAHLDWLIAAKVIVRNNCHYSFNKDYDQWRVSRALAYTSKRLTDLVRINLNGKYPDLTEKARLELRKRQDLNYGKGKSPEAKLATPIESSIESSIDNTTTAGNNLGKIATIYEENIGPLTPMIAEELTEISDKINSELFGKAVKEAVKAGVRKLNYIKAILERWRTDGVSERKNQQPKQKRAIKHL